MSRPKRILICPLDWGLGHATRCIPLIRLLLEKKAEVMIAADGRPLELLKLEFPQLQFIVFKGYGIAYPAKGSMAFKMLLAAPGIIGRINSEQRELEQLIEKHNIDMVISDNRYGCYSNKIKSIFITHQLMIKAPLAENALHKTVLRYIKKYSECWIPDVAGEKNLSGDLSHMYDVPANAFFIGALSRFKKPESFTLQKKYDMLAIISGPEPQRTLFEELVKKEIQKTNLKALMACGKTESAATKTTTGNIELVNHLPAEELQEAILQSSVVIARSGYSTVMDLAALGKKAIFIPTPGQTEQEYLAAMFMRKGIAFSQQQQEFDLEIALKESGNYKGFEGIRVNNVLEERVDLLLTS